MKYKISLFKYQGEFIRKITKFSFIFIYEFPGVNGQISKLLMFSLHKNRYSIVLKKCKNFFLFFLGLLFQKQKLSMKRGFNKYGNQGQQESHSEQNINQSNIPSLNFSLINQFASFSPSNGFSDGIIMTLFQVVEQQSRALQELMEKVDTITHRTLQLTEKIKDLKKSKKDEKETDLQQEKKANRNQTIKGGDIVQAKQLVKILFGNDKVYQYKLRLAQKLELPLYRERNFFLEIQLTDIQGNLVKNSNKIPLSLALYSSENPPKFIEKNTAGQKILKGYIQQSLHQSICRFQKIQIKQVTSHFRNGWVFLVIIPSMTPFGCTGGSSDTFVDYTQIEPLVLQRIIVKAKKLKEVRKGVQNKGENQGEGESEPDIKQDQILSQQK